MTKKELIELLKMTVSLIEDDDSIEGRLSYTVDGTDSFCVDAFIREGNRWGQGGALVVQEGQDEDSNPR